MSVDTSSAEKLNSQNVDTAELIVELYSEEIPWRMQEPMAQSLAMLLATELARALGLPKLDNHRLDNVEGAFGKQQLYSTPRRVAVAFDSVPKESKAWQETLKGPRVASPQVAVDGFLRKNKLGSTKECFKIEDRKGDYYAINIDHRSVATNGILGEVVSKVVMQMQKELKVSMRFADQSFRWVRPLRHILVVFAGAGVEGSINLGGELDQQEKLDFTNRTRGATLGSAEPFLVASIKDYEKKLRDNYVEPIYEQRLEIIKKDVESVNDNQNIIIEENACLTEYPCVLTGHFYEEFLSLPLGLIEAVLNHHQKIIYNVDYSTARCDFYFVANISQTTDKNKAIRGVERVVRARLADAKFMLERDKRIPIAEHIKKLEEITFHPKLGSIADKNSRVKKLIPIIISELEKHNDNFSISKDCNQAWFAKEVDQQKMGLATETVREFPKLQEIISEGLKPRNIFDVFIIPSINITELADAVDSLITLWFVGERASGSSDPFALRRYATTIINNLIKPRAVGKIDNGNNNESCVKESSGYYLPLSIIFDEILNITIDQGIHLNTNTNDVSRYYLAPEPIPFITTRIYQWMRYNYEDVRVDCIEAILIKPLNIEDCNILKMIERIKTLSGEMDKNNNLAEIYNRLQAILSSDLEEGEPFLLDAESYQEGKLVDHIEAKDLPNEKLFEKPEEKALFAFAKDIIMEGKAWDELSYQKKLESLANLKSLLDAFFDKVMVNVEDKKIRHNRVILLYRIFRRFGELANFSKIHHKDLKQQSRQQKASA